MGIRFVPWIIHRFKQLYAKYSSDSVSFDLRAILIFERVNCKHPLSNQPFRMCPDNKDFSLNLQWMSDLGKCCSLESHTKPELRCKRALRCSGPMEYYT